MHGFHQFTTIGFDAMTTIVEGVKNPVSQILEKLRSSKCSRPLLIGQIH